MSDPSPPVRCDGGKNVQYETINLLWPLNYSQTPLTRHPFQMIQLFRSFWLTLMCESVACGPETHQSSAATASKTDRSTWSIWSPGRNRGPPPGYTSCRGSPRDKGLSGPTGKWRDNTLPQLLPDYVDKTFTQHTWVTKYKVQTFLVNFPVLISTNPALTAFMKLFWLPKVTRPEPIGYL